MVAIRSALVPVVAATALASPALSTPRNNFDLQAHRGGIGLTVESTLASFSTALSLGVTTLELDIQITKDHIAVVTHDRVVDPTKCSGAHTGKYVKDLTYEQLRTLDCGSTTLPQFPRQRSVPGEKMPSLRAVLELVRQRGGGETRLNIETKVEAGSPTETAPREEFVRIVAEDVRRAGLTHQVTIQSFDWSALRLMRSYAPEFPLYALVSPAFSVNQTSSNPWLGGIALKDYQGDIVAAAHSLGASAISPQYGQPQDGSVHDPDFTLLVTPEYIAHAHDLGLKVVPWTVDDKATMTALVRSGVDGIITNYPDLLRVVLAECGYDLPPQR